MSNYKPVLLPGAKRNYGMFIAGNPGQGKSSLIQQMALMDIRHGLGVCVIDPHGDLNKDLLDWIPKDRVADTIYFDTDSPIPIDFFHYDHPSERTMLLDELVNVFDLESAPVSNPRLYSMIGTFLDANEKLKDDADKYVLLDILPFINSESFRKEIYKLRPEREADWTPFPPAKEFFPILNRLRHFTEPGPLRNMFSRSKNKLNISNVMRDSKILLITLNETATDLFLASLIAAKFQQATFARKYVEDRTPYHLYVDECRQILAYAANHFEMLLTGARKFQLCLILSTQLPSRLPEGIKEALGTIKTHLWFQLAYEQLLPFQRSIPYDIAAITRLQPFDAVFSLEGRASLIETPTFLGKSPASYAKDITNRTKDLYTCSTPQVCATKNDGNNGPKSDDIAEGAAPNVPPHQGKNKNS